MITIAGCVQILAVGTGVPDGPFGIFRCTVGLSGRPVPTPAPGMTKNTIYP